MRSHTCHCFSCCVGHLLSLQAWRVSACALSGSRACTGNAPCCQVPPACKASLAEQPHSSETKLIHSMRCYRAMLLRAVWGAGQSEGLDVLLYWVQLSSSVALVRWFRGRTWKLLVGTGCLSVVSLNDGQYVVYCLNIESNGDSFSRSRLCF